MAGKTDPGRTAGLGQLGGRNDACGGLFEAVALTRELQYRATMHEAVQDRGGHGGVAQVLAPVVHHPVGGDVNSTT